MPGDHDLEVWGGYECSVVRIGSVFRDQVEETGHDRRLDDLDRAYALGIRTLRHPALWETISPSDPDTCDWLWHDVRFERMRELGLRPIVGLLHHGSGPLYTDLLDPMFPTLLERHAERVVQRYPWIESWTPVNEPLTTARFSALYGHWHPHKTDTGSFLRATVAQCKATVLAMRAIRRIKPDAELVQTEDVGKTFSTPDLAGQARFENERRWLSLDLLFGRVDAAHPWRSILLRHGIAEADLDLFLAFNGAPEVIGVNHYLTSERFLDPNWGRYPTQFRGSNGTRDYADIEAVRIDLPPGDLGPKARLREVLERYGRPVAVTEAHHGCSREEQLRWLAEVWTAASELKAEGSDVRAVTVWSLAGAVDWNSLLVARNGAYEPGAFDVRSPVPRRTALGRAVTSLVETGRLEHPVLGPGWWRREERLYRPSARGRVSSVEPAARPILILGAERALGQAFARICEVRGLPAVAIQGQGAADALQDVLEAHRAWAVVDASSITPVLRPGDEGRAGQLKGTVGIESLASACARRGTPLVVVSSALVFDGYKGRPYTEADAPCPACESGAETAAAEQCISTLHPAALLVRAGALFGPWDLDSYAGALLARPPHAGPSAVPPSVMSFSYIPDLAHAALDLLIDGECGVWHLASGDGESWSAFAARLSAAAGVSRDDGHPPAAPGPARSFALASHRGWIMPRLDEAIVRFLHDVDPERRTASLQATAG